MKKNNEVLEKIKNMPREEVVKYYNAAVNANRLLNWTGILVLFTALLWTNVFTLVGAGMLSYMLAQLSVDISATVKTLEEELYESK